MKESRLLVHTLRETPREADGISKSLLMRAGMLQRHAPGVYSCLPLAVRCLHKLGQLIRDEFAREGCQEILLAGTGDLVAWSCLDPSAPERRPPDGAYALGPDGILSTILRHNLFSYKQLPIGFYQFRTGTPPFPPSPSDPAGSREWVWWNACSFSLDEASEEDHCHNLKACYGRLLAKLGLEVNHVEADGESGESGPTHEFHVLADSGESALLLCDTCSYGATAAYADAPRIPPVPHGPPMPLRPSHFKTPGIWVMEDQIRAFKDEEHDGLPLHQTSKVCWLDAAIASAAGAAEAGVRTLKVGVVLRCDHDISLGKVRNCLHALSVAPMADAEAFTGAQSGFLGPVPRVGTPHWHLQQTRSNGLVYLVDESLAGANNLTCGANETGAHHFGFDPARDLPNAVFADLRMARHGDRCGRCGEGIYQASHGIQVGRMVRLAATFARRAHCTVLDEGGKERLVRMVTYRIGLGQVLEACIQNHHDQDGLVWPWAIAPFHVHLLNLDPGDGRTRKVAGELERDLEVAGVVALTAKMWGKGPTSPKPIQEPARHSAHTLAEDTTPETDSDLASACPRGKPSPKGSHANRRDTAEPL